MTVKQMPGSLIAPDGSYYVTNTDGFGNLAGATVADGVAIPSVSVSSAATLFTIADTSGYNSISIQVTSPGTTCTITYEGSEDGVTWFIVIGYTAAAAAPTNSASTSSTTATNIIFPLFSKMFRARVSTYTSGTVTIQGTLRTGTIPRQSLTVGGGSNDAGAVSATGLSVVAEGRTTNKTAVATGQYVRPIATTIGALINRPYQVPELDWVFAVATGGIVNTTTAVTLVGAAAAGIRNYCTGITLSAATLGAATEVAIRDGAAGTVIWRGTISTVGMQPTLITFPTPLKSTAATLLEFVTLTAVTGGVYISAQGYQAP